MVQPCRIFCYPHPVLRTISTPFDLSDFTEKQEELLKLQETMLQAMYEADGVGLAANQIGLTKRIIVLDVERNSGPLVLFNPKIIKASGKLESDEGCLSIPEYRDKITRANEITVSACNINGEEILIEAASDLFSRCLQHEIDHLDGILFIDHLSTIKRTLFKKWWKRQESQCQE
jgi:peptide deformylase